MAGLAFLPWEQWIGRLVHAVAVAIMRKLHQLRRTRSLEMSAAWPQTDGTVHAINFDSSYPREEIVYYYSTESGYHSGFFWRWFDSLDLRAAQVGDRLMLRYDPEEHDKSVLLTFR
jgi:hypothetical protein